MNTDFTLGNSLFGSKELTKNTDPGKYKYSGYSIGFDSRSEFSFIEKSVGKNVIIFRADMSSSEHIDNKNNNILILGERPTLRLYDTTLKAKAKDPINFTQLGERFVLSIH